MKNKKYLVVSLILIILIVIAVGASYAWLRTTRYGEKEYVIKAGSLNIILDESLSEGVSIENAKPMSDETGKLQEEKFTFAVENTGTFAVDYNIYLDDLELALGEERVEDSFIKFNVVENDTAGGATLLSAVDRKIVSGKVEAQQKNVYELRVWIDKDADNSIIGNVFSTKLRVEAIQSHS